MYAIKWNACHGSRRSSWSIASRAPEGIRTASTLFPITTTAAAFALWPASGATAISKGLPSDSMPCSIHMQFYLLPERLPTYTIIIQLSAPCMICETAGSSAYQVLMHVWRCNMFAEIGYSRVDLDYGVSNLLQRPRAVSTNAVATPVACRSACNAVHFGCSMYRQRLCVELTCDTAGQRLRFIRRCTMMQAASSRLT